MNLSYRQEHQLRRIRAGVLRSDPHLGAMLGVFGRLYAGEGIPAWEQVPRSQYRRQPVTWIVAALTAVAAAIGALVSTVSVATAGWHVRTRAPAAKRERIRPRQQVDAQQEADSDQKPRHQGRADAGPQTD